MAAVLAVVLLAVLGMACAEESAGPAVEGVDLPDWLDRVYPAPGQEATGAQDVQVEHNVVAPDEVIYLILDGTEVTPYAQEGRGELVYDPDRDPSGQPVQLDPGEHSATAQRARVEPDTGEIVEILDEFSWDFTIL